MKNRKQLIDFLDLMFFTLPAVLCVMIVTNIPFLMNIYYALFNWNGTSKTKEFVGLDNFIRVFTNDVKFWNSTLFTLKYAVVFVICINVVALFFANILARRSRIANVTRSFFFVPYIISLVAISLIWKFIFGPGFESLFKLTSMSIFNYSWLGDPKLAFYSTMFVTIWQNVGFYVVIYIAGLMAVPMDILEAAEIDGASSSKVFMKIKLPLLMPSITICMFSALTYAFKLFDIILVLTKGGPADATASVAYNIYKEAFQLNRYGIATAKSLILFIAVLIITLIQLKFFKSKEVEY